MKTPRPTVDLTLVATGPARRDSAPTSEEAPAVSQPALSDRFAVLAASLPVVPRDAYALGEQVAKGGIGRVRRARDERLDRSVALKELLVRDEAQERRFVREALLTARLQHPAIVPVYEAGRWPDGEPFYAMKLVSGRTLSDLIAQSPGLARRMALLPHVLTVAQAIAYAHGQRVIHRDIKPSNVLVGDFGETVIIDWGVAKQITERETLPPDSAVTVAEGLTLDGAVVGTPAYMPPEQARGKTVDERADIYALGAMLYHLVAARAPYEGVPADRLLTTIATKPPRPVEEHDPAIPVELSTIIHKAMARDPDARYPTAKALAEDLERFQTGQIVGAHSYSTAQLVRRFWKRHRIAIAGSAAALALVLAVVVVALVKTEASRRLAISLQAKAESAGQAAETAERQATARADQLTLLQAESAVERDPNTAIAWLKTLSTSFADVESVRRIAADAMGHGIGRVYRGHKAAVGDLALLDGGRRFVTPSDDRTLRIWDVESGSSRVLEGHTDEVWYAAVFPVGDRIVSISRDHTARVWQVETGVVQATVPVPSMGRMVIRADGAVIGNDAEHAWGPPWVWPPGATAVHALVDPKEPLAASAISSDGERAVVETKDHVASLVDTESGARRALGPAFGDSGTWVLSHDGHAAVRTRARRQGPREHEVWDLDTRKRYTLTTPGLESLAAFTPRGDLLALVSEETVAIVEARTGTLVQRLPGQGAAPNHIAFSDDARTLAVGAFDGTVSTWDLTTGEMRTHMGLQGAVSRIVFLPDQRTLLATSWGGSVRMFKPTREGVVLSDHRARATGLAVSAEGRVASMDEEGHLRIVDLSGTAVAEHAFDKRANPVLLTSPDQRRFAGTWLPCVNYEPCPPADKAGRGALLIGAYSGARPMIVTTPAAVLALAWRAEADGVFVALLDGTVQYVKLDGAMTEIDRLSAPAGSLAVSEDGKLLAMGGDDGLVRVMDLAASTRRDLGRHADRVRALTFARGGALLASGSRDDTARVWKLSDGSHRVLVAPSAIVQLAFSADGKVIVSTSRVGLFVQRWSTESGEELPPFSGHRGPMTTLSFSSDGRHLLTGSQDRSARLFDAATGKSRALQGHKGPVIATAFAAGGKLLVTLGEEGVVRAWPDDLPTDMPELRAALEAATPDRIEGR